MPDDKIQSVVIFYHTKTCNGNFLFNKMVAKIHQCEFTDPQYLETYMNIVNVVNHIRN